MQLSIVRHRARGFTLTELAVVFAIVALLIGGAMMTLSAQVEVRNQDETRRRLDAAVEALVAFAIVNRRLPCPAAGATGDESPAGGGTCTTYYGGLLPARAIGLQNTDASGYALDAWGNRLRYAVSNMLTACTGTPTLPHFTSQLNLKANGVNCRPNDLDICQSSTGNTTTTCGTAARTASVETVAVVVFSTGKNGSIGSSHGADEQANLDSNRVFVSRTPSGADSAVGAYDDAMVWLPAGMLYSKLISAGVLP